MLQTGLIGNTEKLEPFIRRLQKNKGFDIIGKASTGTPAVIDDFHYSIPEINRIELIERADVLLIDDSFTSPFPLLASMVKKSKHIFTTDYLNLTTDECGQLIKLANESGSVVQVYNPFYYFPAVRWMCKSASRPVFLEVTNFSGEGQTAEKPYPIILMLLDITGINPKKVAAVTFKSVTDKSNFTNVRLEFDDASVANLNYGNVGPVEEFAIRSYSQNQFIHLDFTEPTYLCNSENIDLTEFQKTDEFTSFANAIRRTDKARSSLEDYLVAMQLVQKINKKTNQFMVE